MKKLQALSVSFLLVVVGPSNAAVVSMYWNVNGSVFRSNGDGSNVQKILSGGTAANQVFYAQLDVDSVNGHLYVQGGVGEGGNFNTFIRRYDLDGTGGVNIASNVGQYPYGLAVSPDTNLILTQYHLGGPANYRMYSASLSGGAFQPIPFLLQYSHDIEVDPVHGKIYFMDASVPNLPFRGIRRMNLDGSNVEAVVPFTGSHIANFALDVQNETIYYIVSNYVDPNNAPAGGYFGRVGFDGSNNQVLATGAQFEEVGDIDFDPIYRKLHLGGRSNRLANEHGRNRVDALGVHGTPTRRLAR